MPDRADLERRLRDTEGRLRTAEARAAALYEHAPDPMLELDGDGRIRSANTTALTRLGDELVGRPFHTLFSTPASGMVGRAFRRELDSSIDRELELADGRVVLLRAVPIVGDDDGCIVALRDVSERTALRAELEQGRRLAAIGRIVGGIAHEVNNPLTVLQLRIDLLAEDESIEEDLRRQVELLRESVRRLVRTVRSLQRVSRPNVPHPEPLAVHVLVGDSVGGVREDLPQARVTVEPVAPSLRVRGDPDALRVAIEQLVVAAAGQGFAAVRVTTAGPRVRVEVSVPRGTWSDGAADDGADGQLGIGGVGLSLAGTIALDHGGEVQISRGPEGSGLLCLDLPLVANGGADARAGPARILVVDDEPLVASVLADYCRRAGHTVDVAETAEEVMERVRRGERWDALLADDRLPGTSGRELVAWLACEQPALARRCALMSGARLEAWNMPFLPKPFTRRQLAELLDALLVS